MNPYELRKKFHNFVQTSQKPWYKVVNQAEGPTQVLIYDAIGGFGVSADAFVSDLNKITGPIELRISSEGGEVWAAKTIYNALASKPDLSVYIDGLAASAASFIAMAASPGKLFMSATGSMMIHDGQTLAMGNASDIRALADVLDRESNTIANIYASRSADKDAAYFRAKMQAETWYNAVEALAEGLVDGIIDPRTGKVTITNKLRNAAHHGYVSQHDTHHEPMTGYHSHNHAAFGHDDADDGQHAHSHFHSDDATHEHAHSSHTHNHEHGDNHHGHAHDAGDDNWGPHEHEHTHHAGHENWDPDHDGDNDASPSGDTDHDYAGRASNKVTEADFFDDGTPIILASVFSEAEFYDRTFTTQQRKRLAKSGAARRDGSYPIETCQDALNARKAYGRSNDADRGSVAAHIRSRESALGGCGRDTFHPGADNMNPLVITDEEAVKFAAGIKL